VWASETISSLVVEVFRVSATLMSYPRAVSRFLRTFSTKNLSLAGIQNFDTGNLASQNAALNDSREEVAWCTEAQFP